MNSGFIIPAQGRNLIAKLQIPGTELSLTRIMVGSGSVADTASLENATSLITPVAQATSSIPTVENGQVSFTVEYSNSMNGGLAEGFWLNEFGIFAQDPDIGEVLLYYATLGSFPQYVQAYTAGNEDVRRFPVAVGLSTNASVILKFPALAFIDAGDLAAAINAQASVTTIEISNAINTQAAATTAEISSAINAQANETSTQINTLQDNISAVGGQVDSINSALITHITQADVTTTEISNAISATSAEIDGVRESVNALSDTTTESVTSLRTDLTAVGEQVDTISSTLTAHMNDPHRHIITATASGDGLVRTLDRNVPLEHFTTLVVTFDHPLTGNEQIRTGGHDIFITEGTTAAANEVVLLVLNRNTWRWQMPAGSPTSTRESRYVVYTARFDMSHIHPTATYLDDAAGFTPSGTDNIDATHWGWRHIYGHIQPWRIHNGALHSHLNRSNPSLRVDGGQTFGGFNDWFDALSWDGGIFTTFPLTGYRVLVDGNFLIVSVTNYPPGSRHSSVYPEPFLYNAHTTDGINFKERMWLGSYLSSDATINSRDFHAICSLPSVSGDVTGGLWHLAEGSQNLLDLNSVSPWDVLPLSSLAGLDYNGAMTIHAADLVRCLWLVMRGEFFNVPTMHDRWGHIASTHTLSTGDAPLPEQVHSVFGLYNFASVPTFVEGARYLADAGGQRLYQTALSNFGSHSSFSTVGHVHAGFNNWYNGVFGGTGAFAPAIRNWRTATNTTGMRALTDTSHAIGEGWGVPVRRHGHYMTVGGESFIAGTGSLFNMFSRDFAGAPVGVRAMIL